MTNAIEIMRDAARELANACTDAESRGINAGFIQTAIARLNIAIDEWCEADGVPYEAIAEIEGEILDENDRTKKGE